MSKKPKRRETSSEFLTIRCPPRLLEAIKEASDKDRRTVSDWCRLAIEDAVRAGKKRRP